MQNPSHPLIIGLTGGIGSGKSAVSSHLETLGATLIDTDCIAHELTSPNGLAMPQIIKTFGLEAAHPDGSLNRTYMRELVFQQAKHRQTLEDILHPLIRQQVLLHLKTPAPLYHLLIVPLLIEKKHWLSLPDGIVVVDCSVELQIERVMRRNGFSHEKVQAILNTQATRPERLAHATWVIQNDNSLESLIQQTELTHQKILQLRQKNTEAFVSNPIPGHNWPKSV